MNIEHSNKIWRNLGECFFHSHFHLNCQIDIDRNDSTK